MEHIAKTIAHTKTKRLNSITVNSNNKYKYINTVNSKDAVSKKIDHFLEELNITPEGVAEKLAEDLDDLESRPYYILLARNNQPGRLLEALGYVKDADKKGAIRTKKAIYFLAILRRWGIKTKFKHD